MSTEVATEGYNLTVVKHPFYVRNTIDLIRRLQPGVKTIALISDDRYISTMVREEVSSVLKKDFPELGLDLVDIDGDVNREIAGYIDGVQQGSGYYL